MFKAFSSSLSLRLLCIFLLTAILLFGILVGGFSQGMRGQWQRTIQPHLVQYVRYVQQDLGNPPEPARADALSQRLLVDIYIYKDEELIYSTNGTSLRLDELIFHPVKRRSSRWDENEPTSLSLKAAITDHDSTNNRILRIRQRNFLVYYDLTRQHISQGRRNRFGNELALALLGLSLVLVISYIAIRHQLRPIRDIQKSVSRMSNAELSHRINRDGNSDLDVLAQSIDSMAERLQALLDAKRQLLMALSHELRSPITRATITTELLPDSKNRDRLKEDLKNMERMIHDIMESEQLQSNHSVLNKDELDIEELLIDELHHQCPTVNLRITEAYQKQTLSADAARLRIAFRNLLLNAQQHGASPDSTADISVTLDQTATDIVVSIRDQGQGIDPEHLKYISDPFYRPDASRTRTTGGFGLGLTLARLIVEAHSGNLQVKSHPDIAPGTLIDIYLPMA